ncbi:MAG: TAXI family TRAP transporter solute-binding subunit [Sulfolobales archaeon]|nr:TAXI family TRAP transporter solute-binding subunit [Sulfolobales archaeon]
MAADSSRGLLIVAALLVLALLVIGSVFLFQQPSPAPRLTPTPGVSPTPTPTPEVTPTPTPTPTPGLMPRGKVTWSIGTTTVGGIGYVVHSALAEVMGRLYPQFFEITASPVGGAAAATAAWDDGRVDLGYTALNVVYQYTMRTERWDPAVRVAKRYDEMSVVIYQFPLIYTIFVTEDIAPRVRCWSDIRTVGAREGGVGVYATPTAFASHEVFRRVFSTLLGVRSADLDRILNIQVFDVSRVGDELTAGRIKIVWGYGDPSGPAPWVIESFSKVGFKLVAVPPCAEEISKLRMLSDLIFLPMDLALYNVKTRDGKSSIEATVATPFGLLASSKLSKEHVYLFVKAHFEQCRTLEQAIATFRGFCQWGISFNLEAFKTQSVYGAKVHPGTALAFKELGYDLERMGILVAREP